MLINFAIFAAGMFTGAAMILCFAALAAGSIHDDSTDVEML